jgi:hypothetical protein
MALTMIQIIASPRHVFMFMRKRVVVQEHNAQQKVTLVNAKDLLRFLPLRGPLEPPYLFFESQTPAVVIGLHYL